MAQNSDASGLAMTTGGDYSLSTRGAKNVIDRATPRFRRLAAAGQATGDHLVIADFGCADGGTGFDHAPTGELCQDAAPQWVGHDCL